MAHSREQIRSFSRTTFFLEGTFCAGKQTMKFQTLSLLSNMMENLSNYRLLLNWSQGTAFPTRLHVRSAKIHIRPLSNRM